MLKLIRWLLPPEGWKTPVAIAGGMFAGLAIYIFYTANAFSYLSDNPKVCVNCHIMSSYYATWSHGSHKTVTNCNDCHVPHNNVFNHYFFKAKDGFRHSKVFTLRQEPQVIMIKEAGLKVVQENCKRCHNFLNQRIGTLSVTGKNYQHGQGELCWQCHRETPHGRVNSLSSAPFARVPLPESPVPGWLNNLMLKEKTSK